MSLSAKQALDTINAVFGRHPGYRALHAKGTLCTAEFQPAAQAARLTRAGHMTGSGVQATVRFSNGAGNPRHADRAPDPRGMAVKFYLPDGSRTDIVAVSSPLFPVRTPDAFIELIEAQGAGPGAAVKLPLFLARHPEAARALPVIAPTLLAPDSYATIAYYGLHAFKWIDASGGERYVRYTWRPAAHGSRLAPWKSRRMEPDYLQSEIRHRVEADTVLFSLVVQIAAPGDPVDDPSAAWPKQRERVTVGTLRLTGIDHEREQGNDVLVFDPTRVTDGIECSADPVLAFRPKAYSESVARRAGG